MQVATIFSASLASIFSIMSAVARIAETTTVPAASTKMPMPTKSAGWVRYRCLVTVSPDFDLRVTVTREIKSCELGAPVLLWLSAVLETGSG
jgi:hypothetical protein